MGGERGKTLSGRGEGKDIKWERRGERHQVGEERGKTN